MEPTRPLPSRDRVRPVRKDGWLDNFVLQCPVAMLEDVAEVAARAKRIQEGADMKRAVQERARREAGTSLRSLPAMRYLGALSYHEHCRLKKQFGERWPEERAKILSAMGAFGDIKVTSGK